MQQISDRKYAPIVLSIIIALAVISVLVSFVSLTAGLALFFGSAISVIVFFKPIYGLILYIVLTYIMPQIFFSPLQDLRIMLVLSIQVLLVFFIHAVLKKKRIGIISSRNSILMLTFLIFIALSNIAHFEFASAWEGIREFLEVFFLFFIIINIVENFDDFKRVCQVLIICTIMLAINGLIMQFRGYDLIGSTPTLDGRISGIRYSHFGDPNDFALAIISFFPFILVHLFEPKFRKLKKIIFILIICILLMAIYYSNSRGGYIALIAVLALFAIKKWGIFRGIVAAGIFFALSIAFAPSRMADISLYESSASGRVDAWIAGLVMLKSYPAFGVGYMRFSDFHSITAHSAFIQCMAELGLLGYFVWLTLIYSSYTGLRSVERSASEIYAKYARILQISLTGFLVSAVFLSQAYTPILFILLALSTLVIRFSEPFVAQKRSLLPRDILTILVLIGCSIGAYKLLAMIYI